MNYIYDITLNFNSNLYNFYEWENEDNVEVYLKIPVFKVEDEVINDFIISTFLVEKKFLNLILNNTELYGKSNVKINKYSCIFTTNDKAVAVLFNEKGESIKKSYLSIDEENEVLDYSKYIKYTIMDYRIKEKKSINNFVTRNEKNTRNKLKTLIKNMYENKEYDKLKYIFYEVYNEKNDNELKMYSKLINIVDNNTEKMNKINNIFNNIKTPERIN